MSIYLMRPFLYITIILAYGLMHADNARFYIDFILNEWANIIYISISA